MSAGASEWQLAQINIGRLVAPVDDPRIAEFVAQLGPVNRLAEESAGFVWRLQSAQGDATDLDFNGDPLVIVNMSVWESVAALQAFTYRVREHVRALRDRRKWFEKMDLPHYCLWWVKTGHRPSVSEGRGRLELYQKLGATREAFWFQEPFPAPVGELVAG